MTDLAITSAIASNYQGMIAMVGADHRVYLGKPENCYLSPEGDAPAYPNRRLPLAEWGLTEPDCLEYCQQLGFQWLEETENGPVPLYEILDRVSCWCCGNKNLKELKHIYLYLPQYWERLKGLQAHMSRPMKGWYQDGRPKGIFELERRFEQELQEAAKSGRARRAPGKKRRGRGPER